VLRGCGRRITTYVATMIYNTR